MGSGPPPNRRASGLYVAGGRGELLALYATVDTRQAAGDGESKNGKNFFYKILRTSLPSWTSFPRRRSDNMRNEKKTETGTRKLARSFTSQQRHAGDDDNAKRTDVHGPNVSRLRNTNVQSTHNNGDDTTSAAAFIRCGGGSEHVTSRVSERATDGGGWKTGRKKRSHDRAAAAAEEDRATGHAVLAAAKRARTDGEWIRVCIPTRAREKKKSKKTNRNAYDDARTI